MRATGHPFERIFAVLLPAVVVSHVVGALVAPELVWGANFYAFFPTWLLVIAVVALSAFLATTLRSDSKLGRTLDVLPDPGGWTRSQRLLLGVAAAVLAGVIDWTFRIRHTLLGDGNSILLTLPRGDHFHPRQPLTVAWTAELYALVRSWGPQNQQPDVSAQTAVALASVLAGMFFVPVAWCVSQELARTLPRDSKPARAVPRTISFVWLATGILLAQGYVQLFFGYVENYTTYLLAIGVFLWLALRHLDGRAPLAAPLVTAFMALGLHLSAGVLFPALAYLVFEALRRPDRRRAALRDLGIAALATAALAATISSPPSPRSSAKRWSRVASTPAMSFPCSTFATSSTSNS
jgi:hypothetical protein